MKLISALIGIILFLGSCVAYERGYLQSSAALSSANFRYVEKNVKGRAVTGYFLGIGGFNKAGLVGMAKQDLLKNHPLKENQALVNITVDYKVFVVYWVFHTRTCIITGDIVEFVE